jgi:hypothetical protein
VPVCGDFNEELSRLGPECSGRKLWSIEPKSHIMALVADDGLALFCGLNAMPKKSFLSKYSSRITPHKVSRLLALWHGQLTGEALLTDESLNLDFHSVPYFGEHPRWSNPTIVTLEISSRKHRTPRVYEQKAHPHQRQFRQFFITDLGHDEPTILLTNDAKSSAKTIITRYAKRMLIENALSDAVRFFHIDALSSSFGFKIDFDMALLVLASGLYRLMARRMRGYDDAQARQIFRDLIDMPADIAIAESEITVRFHRRAHLPIVLACGLFDKPVAVPWWNNRPLRLIQ